MNAYRGLRDTLASRSMIEGMSAGDAGLGSGALGTVRASSMTGNSSAWIMEQVKHETGIL
jgi:hypothetical protein